MNHLSELKMQAGLMQPSVGVGLRQGLFQQVVYEMAAGLR
jgi:hypothetical protein